jgi:hypothetical protein
MTDQHARFLSRLRDSSRAVFAVAFFQHQRGRRVEIPPLKFAPDASQHELFVDEGDLYVWVGDKRLRFEIKHLGVNFTGAGDWPFREAFVSNVAAVDRATDVHFYVSVSNDMRHAAIISRKTRDSWYTTTALAQNTGNAESFYACPMGLVVFEQLDRQPQRGTDAERAGHSNGFVGYDSEDRFVHYCRCGKDAGLGHGVRLAKGELGVWYCAEHNPQPKEQQQ